MSAWRRRDRENTVTSLDGGLVRTLDGDPVISVEDAKAWLRVEDDIEDEIIERAVLAVQGLLVPPAGWLGRALTTAEFRLDLPCFGDRITIPAPPLQQIDSFEYRDHDGDMQTVDSGLYRVTAGEPAVLVRERGASWPTDVDSTQPDAVQISFTAGYGLPADVPDAIKQWMLFQVSQIHDIRQPVIVGNSVSETPFIRHMLESYRVR